MEDTNTGDYEKRQEALIKSIWNPNLPSKQNSQQHISQRTGI